MDITTNGQQQQQQYNNNGGGGSNNYYRRYKRGGGGGNSSPKSKKQLENELNRQRSFFVASPQSHATHNAQVRLITHVFCTNDL